jgi:hypothetical protein
MKKSEDYRHNAASCLRMAKQATDLAAKTALLHMARAWNDLAGQRQRNLKTDIVYETPAPRPPEHHQPVVQQQQQQIQPRKEESET